MRILYYAGGHAQPEKIGRFLSSAGLKPQKIGLQAAENSLSALDPRGSAMLPLVMTDSLSTENVLRSIRKSGTDTPILVLQDPPCTRVEELLDAGADDVARISAGQDEVAARLRAITRRAFGQCENEIEIGDFIIPLDGRNPTVGGVEVRLTSTEYQIVKLIAMSHPRVLSKGAIYDALYAFSSSQPFDKVIDVHIFKIRQKIMSADTLGRSFIETEIGRGYALRQT